VFLLYGTTSVTLEDVSSIYLSVNFMKLLTVVGEKKKQKDSASLSGKIDEGYKFSIRLWKDIVSLIFFRHVHCQ